MTSATGWFATISQVKTYLGLSGTGPDTLIDAILPGVTARIEKHCNRTFQQESFTEYYSGDGASGLIFVKHPPISGVGDLRDDPNRSFAASSRFNSTNDYVMTEDTGEVQLLITLNSAMTIDGAYFQKGVKNIKIVYTGGWGTCPDDVAHAAVLWTADIYNKLNRKIRGLESHSQGGPGGEKSESFVKEEIQAGIRATYSIGMPKDVYLILEQYRVRSV